MFDPSCKLRFWSMVAAGGPDECWPWTGAMANGYGRFRVTGTVTWQAHRTAYELVKGLVAKGQVVRHKCDNPKCCNPNHLLVGTQKDNAQDCVSRGRHMSLPGESNPSSKLTEDDIKQIRAATGPLSAIANKHKTGVQNVKDIRAGRRWKHVPA